MPYRAKIVLVDAGVTVATEALPYDVLMKLVETSKSLETMNIYREARNSGDPEWIPMDNDHPDLAKARAVQMAPAAESDYEYVLRRATEKFGETEAKNWMVKGNFYLNGRTPSQAIEDRRNIDGVLELLY